MQHKGTAMPAGQGFSKHGSARKSRIAYTVTEFAALLGVRPDTVYDWIKKGLVPFERIGHTYFIPESALGCLRPSTGRDTPVPAAPGGDAA